MHRFAIARSCALVLVAACGTNAEAGCAPPYAISGHATYYSPPAPPANGACGMPIVDGQTAAIASARWVAGAHCGDWLNVVGPNGAVTVKVTDECNTCSSDIDLTQAAFAQIASIGAGNAAITWQRVDAPISGNPQLVVATGSSAYYFKMYADNTLQGVSAISVLSNSGWQSMMRTGSANFEITPSGMLPSPLQIQLTSESGEIQPEQVPSFGAGSYPASAQFGACTDRIFASDMGSTL